ncbi:MAG TPA: phytanoyl-CoA dioxygenase family protein [Chitinophagales bacterium]|nr:phytanoyl-CoA dioxygenase family protein [Chitinophagales bacterium]
MRKHKDEKNMLWSPKLHSIVKDKLIQSTLHETGYLIGGNIGRENISALLSLYSQLHDFKTNEGGMFYSLYSNDIDYRKKVHTQIEAILKPVYETLFTDYKSVINSFIVKIAGPKSDFSLHQDSTGLDENKYSPLSAWIPLQDTDLHNGTICFVPKTHAFFYPYRGISFKAPFAEYENELKKYLVPVNLKAGDILLFDNRLVHYSHINFSETPRIVVMSGLFPSEAEIVSVYKDPIPQNSPLEIYKQSEDFLVTNTAFYNNCTERPYRGEKILEIEAPKESKTKADFIAWAAAEGLKPTNISQLVEAQFTMNIVSEPV